DPSAGPDELEDHPGPGPCLAGSGRALDGEGALVEGRGEAQGGAERGLPRPPERIAREDSVDAGRSTEEELPNRAIPPGGIDAVGDDVVRHGGERLGQGLVGKGSRLDERD